MPSTNRRRSTSLTTPSYKERQLAKKSNIVPPVIATTKFSHSSTNASKERGKSLAKRILQRSIAVSLHYPKSLVQREFKRVRKWHIPIKKPPQIVRWDLLGVLLSNMWGAINSRPLPSFLRSPIYKTWAYLFQANLNEVPLPLDHFPTLKDFFSRPLKEGVRPLTDQGMASPVDGRVVVFGEITNDRVEQVKGVTYTVSGFLGRHMSGCKLRPNSRLYHCVLYLAPGDYHRIHSPDDWSIKSRSHFPGTLFPIAPTIGRLIPNLLALNERVVMMGERSHHGFYSLTAVGAYNVGSISLKFDETVRTNCITRDFRCPNLRYFSFGGVGTHAYELNYVSPIEVEKGEEIGTFNLGSTIVLIFESEDFEFAVAPGDRVQMGQLLGRDKGSNKREENNHNNVMKEDGGSE